MKNIISWLLVIVMTLTPSGVFLNFDTAHATGVTEYPPEGLTPSGWIITDEYNGANLSYLADNNNPGTSYSKVSSNPSTGTAGFVINLGTPTVVDRVYLTGPTTAEGQSTNDGNPANWSNTNNSPPLGIIVVYVGSTPNPTTQVAQAWVPYDAGNSVDTEADLRFQPVVGQYVRVELQTANIDWFNYMWGMSTDSPAVTLPWNVGEVEVHGYAGQNSINPTNYVILPPNAAAAYAAGPVSMGLTAATGNNQVSLSWQNPSTGATSYTIERYNPSSGTYSPVSGGTGITTQPFIDNTVTNGTTYYYAIEAVYGTADSILSTDVSVTPSQTAQAAAANWSGPSWIGASTIAGNNQVVLNWGAVAGATYTVERYNTSSGKYTPLSAGTGIAATTFTDSTVTNGTTYFYVIKAVVPGAANSISGDVSATPSQTAPSAAPSGIANNYQFYLPLITAAEDLSYYLGKLTGNPVPIVPASWASDSAYSSDTFYAIEDLQPYAIDYNTMIANENNGTPPTLPLDIGVVKNGNQVQFSGWPYRNVLKSVWTFLADQGIHWVYPTPHGDYIPVTGSVNLSMLPLTASSIALPTTNSINTTNSPIPTPKSVYANWPVPAFQPWGTGVPGQSLRQGYLNILRNGWDFSWNYLQELGGLEIPNQVPASNTISSTLPDDYSNAVIAFESSYPHNLSAVIPLDVLDANSSWCGYVASSGTRVCSTSGQPTFDMTNAGANDISDPDVSNWIANEITAVASYAPEDLSGTSGTSRHWYALLPVDASTYDQGLNTIQDNSASATSNVPIPDPLPWVDIYGISQSGAYYNLVNQVATQVKAQNPSNPPIVGALAYSDMFLPPPSWLVQNWSGGKFSSNVKVEICQYGSPNLPISTATSSSSPNYAFKQVLEQWQSLGSQLGNYDYTLLHTDFWQPDPQLPVPMVAGIVDRADYLANMGALEGGSQGNANSMPYNPWNFYAYARVRQNLTLTAAQIENEFFTSYFKEAAVPMLEYYQTMENWQVNHNVNMHDIGYAESMTPGSFPNQLLYQMQGYLQQAQSAAQSWIVKKRVADMVTGFNWILTQRNLEAFLINTGGENYNVGDTLNVQGTGAALQVSAIDPVSAITAIVNGGSGYAVGNVVQITGGSNSNATATVSAVGANNAITGIKLNTGGGGFTTTTDLAINGGGTGATVDVTVVPGMIASISLVTDSTIETCTTVGAVCTTGSNLTLNYPSGTGSGSGATVNMTMANLNDTSLYQEVGQTIDQPVSLSLQNGVPCQYYLTPEGCSYVQASSGTQGQFCSGSLTGYGVPSSSCPGAFWGPAESGIYLPLYFAQGGTYTITINAQGASYGSTWGTPPQMTVYLGPQNLGPITVSSPVSAVTINTGGSGYQKGDVLSIIQNGGSGATATVSSIGTGGTITAIALTAAGNGYTPYPNYSTPSGLSVSGGHGTGATVNISGMAENYVLTANVPAGFGVQDFWVQVQNQNAVSISNVSITYTGSAQVNYGDVNGAVNSSGQPIVTIDDAELTAQAAVGLITLTPAQQQAAMVSSNTETAPTIYDAFLIAEYSIGLITQFPVQS